MIGRRMLISIAVTGLMIAGTWALHAQQAPQGQGRGQTDGANMFDRLDANGDGVIDRNEFRGAPELFNQLDLNNDGVISREEFQAARGQMGARRGQDQQQMRIADPAARWRMLLERYDANNDGMITAEEWTGRPEMFQRLDRNQDGVLVEAEVIEAWGQQPPADGRQQRQDPARMLIQMMDTTGDGQVSAQEWAAFFTQADTDGNGVLSHAEIFAKIQEALRPQREAEQGDRAPAPEGER